MMNFLRFLFNKIFLYQILFAIGVSIFIFIGVYFGLKKITHHNQSLPVPELKGVHLSQLPILEEDYGLRFEVLDSSRFSPDFDPFTIMNHNPKAGSLVKKNRKIYLTVNPSGHGDAIIPGVIQTTRRNAETVLKGMGFQIGKIFYRDNIGKDMVLEIRYQGQRINPGAKLPKTSEIDLVLGNGRR